VVASNVRNIRAKSLSIKETREETEVLKKLQIRQEQVEANNQWKQKLNFKNGSDSSIVLYFGLAVSSVGLIIFLVGVGDKGFKSLELQLIGPSLIGLGFLLAIFQIIYCTKPWKSLSCCLCLGRETQDVVKKEPVQNITKLNKSVIKIKSYNEFQEPLQHKLETIAEVSRRNSLSGKQPKSDIRGSLKNLKNATIILNSSNLNIE